MPMDPVETGIPKLVGELAPDERRRQRPRPAPSSPPTPCARRRCAAPSSRDGVTATVGGMAKAQRCCRRRWRRCSRCSPPTPRSIRRRTPSSAPSSPTRSTRSSSTAARAPTTPCSCSPTARSATSRSRTGGAAYALVEAITAACADLAHADGGRRRGSDEARTVVVRGRAPYGRRAPRRAVARSQLVQCSLYGCDPYWGRVLSELGASGARFDPEQVDDRLQRRVVCRNGIAAPARRRRAAGARWQQRDIEIDCDLNAGAGRPRPLHRPHARHTSTRTWGRVMDAAERASPRQGRDPRRGAAVHPRVLGQDAS